MSNDLERLALALLNSDREMAGFPPVESRETIPDSDGYVVNARSILTALRNPSDATMARVLVSMENVPFCDDEVLQGTTQQGMRIEHYARAAITAFIDAYTKETRDA